MVHSDRVRSVLEDAKPPDWLDGDDPYADVDIEQLPDWWHDAIVEFREHNLSPYRPPRFTDDVLVPPLIFQMETAYDIEIKLVGVNVDHGDTWEICVDGEVASTVKRERLSDGYTLYKMTSEKFLDIVQTQL
ncbi:hypothetical protein DJ69_16645 [Halorubrum persicum]|uniref:Uncharacterized protein n=1 Tax=Halorubrum persicum TaxID=1383844 RepID=A0A2G1WEW7_9EURY|nr:hypothetical protein [Halorubrum persicum]PHQ37522.1 hypothetical protein DJ69_16645 [Halorubrum persicum]